MIFKCLRNQILDKAIRGLLVPQLPEDGVVKQIGDRPAEVPFAVPESWKWVSLNRIGVIVSGATPKTAVKEFWNGDINWVTPEDLGKNSSKWIAHGSRFLSKEGLNSCSAVLMPKGSIVYSSRAPIGHIAIAANELCTNQGCKSFVPKCEYISTEWAYYALIARTKDIQSRASGTTFKEISGTGMGNTLIPLPPIAEQKRIAAKIESLFGEIDRAEKEYEELQSLANVLKGQILQKAIQGKLVPQQPEDGVVEQIGKTPSEVPFDIPNSWKWIKLSDVVDVRDGTHESPKYVEKGVPFVTSKNLKNGTIDFSTVKFISKNDHESFIQRSNVEPGDILMAMIGSIGNAIMVPENAPEFSIKNVALFKHKADKLLDFEFLLVLLKSLESIMNTQSSGSVQKFVPLNYLRNMAIPLPPLAEQKRIVAKVEALFEQIDLMTN